MFFVQQSQTMDIFNDPPLYQRPLSKGNIIGFIDILDEVYLSFELVIHSFVSQNTDWQNIIHIGDSNDMFYPSISINTKQQYLLFRFSQPGDKNQSSQSKNQSLSTDQSYTVTFFQNQDWRTISVNNVTIHNATTLSHAAVFNQAIYLCADYIDIICADVTISNLHISTKNTPFNYLCDASHRLSSIIGSWIWNDALCTAITSDAAVSKAWMGEQDATSKRWTDYTVEASFKVISGDHAGIILRAQNAVPILDHGDFFYIGADFIRNHVELGRMNGVWNPIATHPITITHNIAYTLKVQISGQTSNVFQVYLNDVFLFNHTEISLFLLDGSVGIRILSSSVEFTSLMISFQSDNYLHSLPTNDPTVDPTIDPTNDPTKYPTMYPTNDPTKDPTNDPTTIYPTNTPTNDPTNEPTNDPTEDPTIYPSNYPTIYPTKDPTIDPTIDPSNAPTNAPSFAPTSCVDFYDYKSLDGVDFIYPITKRTTNWSNYYNDNHIQQYVSEPGIRSFYHQQLLCNNSNVEMCFILCKFVADCTQSTVLVTPHHDLNELKLICTAKYACHALNINVTAQSKVSAISVWCAQRLSCQMVNIAIAAAYNTDITVQCDETFACKEMSIELYAINSVRADDFEPYTLKATIYCYDDYSCDDMAIHTDHSNNIFITLMVYRYSKDIKIHQLHWQNVDTQCGINVDHRYIRYDTHELLDPLEILQYARNEYESTRKLPCEDIKILCSNNTDFDRECVFQYKLNNFSLFDMLDDKQRPNCYWLDSVQLYKAYCAGRCGDNVAYSAYNKTLELQMVFDSDNFMDDEDDDDEDQQRRLMMTNLTTVSYKVCDEYFGSFNDTDSSLSSIDAIFNAVLQLVASVDGSILHAVLRAPQTELMNNLSFIECKNEAQNTISIITNIEIESIESNRKIIDRLFAANSDFMAHSADLLSELFGLQIKLNHQDLNIQIDKGVKEGVVLAIILSALFIIVVIVLIVIRKRRLEKQRLEALTTYISNPMVLMIGIAFYEDQPEDPGIEGYFRDLDGIHKDIENVRNLFCDKLNYTLYPKETKQEWTAKALIPFLEEKAEELESNLDSYDGLVVFVSCHGVKHNVVTSDYQLIEKTALHRIFSMERPEIRKIPRIFVFDCCAGDEDREAALRTDTIYTSDTRDISGGKDTVTETVDGAKTVLWMRVESVAATERGKNIDVNTVKSNVPMWLYDENNPDYKLVIIEASNEGFQSKMDITSGSYMTIGLTQKLNENIFVNNNNQFLFEICDEIQEELHSKGKQQPTYTYYNKMKYIKFVKNSHEFEINNSMMIAEDAPKDDDMTQKNNNALPEKQSDEVQIIYKDEEYEYEDDDDKDEELYEVNMEMQTAGNPTIADTNEIKLQPAKMRNNNNNLNYKVPETEIIKSYDDEKERALFNEWLTNEVELPQYYNLLVENGYESLDFIKQVTNEEQLKDIGIYKKGHLLKLIKDIKGLQSFSKEDNGDELRISVSKHKKEKMTEMLLPLIDD